MQTFLPYPDFDKSAIVLDNKRLGKQRVETLQILQCLLVKQTRWKSHPAVKMWKETPMGLVVYGLCMCEEWVNRGFKDTCYEKIEKIGDLIEGDNLSVYPDWLGNRKFHQSHKSNLVRKDPEYYQKYFPNVKRGLPYIWPVK